MGTPHPQLVCVTGHIPEQLTVAQLGASSL
jgi:hypothetical protein